MAKKKEQNLDSRQCGSLDFFKGLGLFTGLLGRDVSCFAESAQTRSYKKGEHLYLESNKADFFYIICSGWLRLYHITEDGEELDMAILTTNSITGENAIFEDGRFTTNAQIVEDAQILSIPLKLLKEQLRKNNQLALNMLTSMVHYQRQHELQLKQYFLYSAPQRIGCFLLGLCPILKQKDGVVLNLPYDKKLIASALGMKGETFSRALNILRAETGIHVSGTRVTIDSIKRLLKFVDGCYANLPAYKNLN